MQSLLTRLFLVLKCSLSLPQGASRTECEMVASDGNEPPGVHKVAQLLLEVTVRAALQGWILGLDGVGSSKCNGAIVTASTHKHTHKNGCAVSISFTRDGRAFFAGVRLSTCTYAWRALWQRTSCTSDSFQQAEKDAVPRQQSSPG